MREKPKTGQRWRGPASGITWEVTKVDAGGVYARVVDKGSSDRAVGDESGRWPDDAFMSALRLYLGTTKETGGGAPRVAQDDNNAINAAAPASGTAAAPIPSAFYVRQQRERERAAKREADARAVAMFANEWDLLPDVTP